MKRWWRKVRKVPELPTANPAAAEAARCRQERLHQEAIERGHVVDDLVNDYAEKRRQNHFAQHFRESMERKYT